MKRKRLSHVIAAFIVAISLLAMAITMSADLPLKLGSIAGEADRASKIIFTFDDGWRDNLTYALPIFEAAGIKGTVYASETLSNPYDGNLIMQPSDLQQLYDAGWDIGNHTTTHENIGDLTDKASLDRLKSMYQDNQDWLIENGWIRGAHHVAYPSGLYTDTLIQLLKEMGVKTGRAAKTSGTLPEGAVLVSGSYGLFTIPVIYLETSDDADHLIGSMNKAVATGEDIFVLLHRVGPETAEMTTATTDLKRVVSEAKALSDQGRLSIMTISEWYESVK